MARANARNLQSLIHEIYAVNRVLGDIGLEFEFEGRNLAPGANSRYWSPIHDGSLRNGLEYILIAPITEDELRPALQELKKITAKARFVDSIRCSTHIHLNMQEFSGLETLTFLSFYWLVENLLIETQGTYRKGNLFCLSVSNAEDLMMGLLRDLERKNRFLESVGGDNHRYSGVNLSALKKYGSLEFRFLKVMHDTTEVELWVRNLLNARNVCKKLGTPEEVLNLFRKHTNEEFLLKFFNLSFVKYLFNHVEGFNKGKLDELINSNAPYVTLLVNAVKENNNIKKIFTIPTISKMEDEEHTPDSTVVIHGIDTRAYHDLTPEDIERIGEVPPAPLDLRELEDPEPEGVIGGGLIRAALNAQPREFDWDRFVRQNAHPPVNFAAAIAPDQLVRINIGRVDNIEEQEEEEVNYMHIDDEFLNDGDIDDANEPR